MFSTSIKPATASNTSAGSSRLLTCTRIDWNAENFMCSNNKDLSLDHNNESIVFLIQKKFRSICAILSASFSAFLGLFEIRREKGC